MVVAHPMVFKAVSRYILRLFSIARFLLCRKAFLD